MKAIIQEVKFSKEFPSKFGIKKDPKDEIGVMYSFHVKYDDIVAVYNSKYKDQKKFIPGQEAEFTEEARTYTNNQGNIVEYFVIKPIAQNRQSNFGKALNKEKSRYSGFAVSYAKDLVIADKLNIGELPDYATVLFDLMVTLDKSIES
jgi:hypothetical protein